MHDKDVVELALQQARGKVERLEHRISKAMLMNHSSDLCGVTPSLSTREEARTSAYLTLRAMEAELAVEQRLVSSLEAALAVSADKQHTSATGRVWGERVLDSDGIDQMKQLDATIQMLVARLQKECEAPVRMQQQLTELVANLAEAAISLYVSSADRSALISASFSATVLAMMASYLKC